MYFQNTTKKLISKENKLANSINAFEKEMDEDTYEEPFEVETIVDYSWCTEDVSNSTLTLLGMGRGSKFD